jgi:hypothetical protein
MPGSYLYEDITPPAEHLDSIHVKLDHALAGMREQAQQEVARQQRRLAKLADERTKLLHAYYQGAIPSTSSPTANTPTATGFEPSPPGPSRGLSANSPQPSVFLRAPEST